MDKPLVTILTPVYNMAATIQETLDSLVAQTYTNFEAIVIDDGSKDNSAELAAAYAHGGSKADPRVRFVSQPNAGKVSALNRGLSMANGDIVAILDADDTWPPDSLEKRVGVLVDDPAALAVYGDAEYMDQDSRIYRRRNSRPFFTMGQLLASVICPIIGPTLIARRRVFDEMYPLDTSYIRSDDAYINAEIFKRGKMVYLPEVVLNYRAYWRPSNIRLRILSCKHDLRLVRRYIKLELQPYYMFKIVVVAAIKVAYEIVSSRK